MIDQNIWDDQQEFNGQLRSLPTTYEERMNLTKEFMLHMMAECGSTLDASGAWKMHRRQHVPENRERIKAELIDVFKYWLSIVQAQGFTPEEMAEAYWLKSAAVRQHWAEEWMRNIEQPMVILDLDNVLCDYVSGLTEWMTKSCRKGEFTVNPATIDFLRRAHAYLDARSLNITEREWRDIKHRFRTSGAKRALPPMPGAAQFVEWCHTQGWAVVILTSRPIDAYPNVYNDTVYWLKSQGIVADYIWWGTNKAEKIWEVMHSNSIEPGIVFAVDDDERFIAQYTRAGIRSYWLTRNRNIHERIGTLVRVVHELSDIVSREGENPWDTKTPIIDRTPSTPEKIPTGESLTDPTPSM